MISNNTIVEILKHIYSYNDLNKSERNSIDLIISNELDSVNYYDSQFKILPITKHNYDHLHYKINNELFDVFIYRDYDVDKSNMYQIVMCNNYTDVYNFEDGKYDNKVKVCSFKIPVSIFSFFDSSVIVVKNSSYSECNYDEIVP